MRDNVIAYIKDNLTKDFKLSNELPWTKDGDPLYLKNFKTIYVDRPQTTQEPLYDTLDGVGFVNDTTTVLVYIATDAKKLPLTYNNQMLLLKKGRFDVAQIGKTQRTVLISTEYKGDALVTKVDYSFTQIM